MLSGVLTTAAPVGRQQSCPIALLFISALVKTTTELTLGATSLFSFHRDGTERQAAFSEQEIQQQFVPSALF